MGFHDVRFPTKISRGAVSGPSTFTNITAVDSGGEEAVSRWGASRRKADARKGIQHLEDAQEVLAFYIARNGPANSFRFKDWIDYATTPTGSTWTPSDAAVTATDVLLGVGDGSKTQFQLKKEYTSGPTTSVRNITHPVSGTVRASLDDVGKTEGVDFTVNHTTGIITWNTAPGVGVQVKAGCEFDVPMRFGLEVDLDGLLAAVRGFDSAEIGSIPMIEVVSGLEVQDLFFFGGAADVDTAADFTWTLEDGRVVSVNPTAVGVKMLLPATLDNLPAGAPYFFVSNRHGSNSFEIRVGTAGGTLVATITAGSSAIIVIGHDSGGSKIWRAT